jgi:hypothetical protein
MTTPTNYGRFRSFTNTLAECRVCTRLTHSSVEGMVGIDLCRDCLEDAYLENAHFDGNHTVGNADWTRPDPACQLCNPEANARMEARVAANQAKRAAQVEAAGARDRVKAEARAAEAAAEAARRAAVVRCTYRYGRDGSTCESRATKKSGGRYCGDHWEEVNPRNGYHDAVCWTKDRGPDLPAVNTCYWADCPNVRP